MRTGTEWHGMGTGTTEWGRTPLGSVPELFTFTELFTPDSPPNLPPVYACL
ncbi:Uncharacterised protein [Legionella waltersii]|nr:Uncharacterised protein [Legionella waltersii]